MPRFSGWHPLRQGVATVSQPLLALPSGDAVLAVFYPESQRPCYLMTTPLDEQSTDFVGQPLFVPTFYNMALYSRPPQSPYHLIAAQAAPVVLPSVVTPPVRLTGRYGMGDVTDSVVCMPSVVSGGGSSRMMASNVVPAAGCYRLTSADSRLSLAFNYGRRESLMTFLDADAMPHIDGHTATLSATQPVTLHVGRARSLSHLFLWLALSMLLAEVLLARDRRQKKQNR